MAPVITKYEQSNEEVKVMEKVLTENQKTIADVSAFLDVPVGEMYQIIIIQSR